MEIDELRWDLKLINYSLNKNSGFVTPKNYFREQRPNIKADELEADTSGDNLISPSFILWIFLPQ